MCDEWIMVPNVRPSSHEICSIITNENHKLEWWHHLKMKHIFVKQFEETIGASGTGHSHNLFGNKGKNYKIMQLLKILSSIARVSRGIHKISPIHSTLNIANIHCPSPTGKYPRVNNWTSSGTKRYTFETSHQVLTYIHATRLTPWCSLLFVYC